MRSTGTSTRRPRSSTRVSRPSLVAPDMALATSVAISSGDWGLSMTSSRGECWTPILTSTGDASSSCAAVPHASAADEPPTCGAGAPSANGRGRSALGALAALDPWEAGDAAPCQRRQEGHRLVAGDGALAGQPPAGAGLRQPGQARGQQQCPLPVQAGVGGDDLADGLHAGPVAAVGQLADVVVVVQVGLEDQPERGAVGVDEVEVGADGPVDAGAVVVGALHRLAHAVGEQGDLLLEQCQVQLPLAR